MDDGSRSEMEGPSGPGPDDQDQVLEGVPVDDWLTLGEASALLGGSPSPRALRKRVDRGGLPSRVGPRGGREVLLVPRAAVLELRVPAGGGRGPDGPRTGPPVPSPTEEVRTLRTQVRTLEDRLQEARQEAAEGTRAVALAGARAEEIERLRGDLKSSRGEVASLARRVGELEAGAGLLEAGGLPASGGGGAVMRRVLVPLAVVAALSGGGWLAWKSADDRAQVFAAEASGTREQLEVERARSADLEAALAQVDALELQLESDQLELDQLTVRAALYLALNRRPVDGTFESLEAATEALEASSAKLEAARALVGELRSGVRSDHVLFRRNAPETGGAAGS